jgi:hypothetical protein
MNIAQKIKDDIQRFKLGSTFGYGDFNVPADKLTTAAKAVERLLKKGVIKKLSKGTFYKPKQTSFGDLTPSNNDVIKPYLFDNNKRIAYITGQYLYNNLGLTTQIPSTIKIASLSKRITINKGAVKAKPAKSYVEVTDGNYYLLGLLDALKDFNNISDLNSDLAIKRMIYLIQLLDQKQLKNILKYAYKYPPRVRAVLGAILEYIQVEVLLDKLKLSLNPLSNFHFVIKDENLPTMKNWNIK